VAVIGVAVQGLGMQHELPAFGRGGRCGNRDLAAELVGGAGLAFANALHLGRVQRVDLRSALALLLVANPVGEIEQRTKAILERGIALERTNEARPTMSVHRGRPEVAFRGRQDKGRVYRIKDGKTSSATVDRVKQAA
jgi:hypothetical protein